MKLLILFLFFTTPTMCGAQAPFRSFIGGSCDVNSILDDILKCCPPQKECEKPVCPEPKCPELPPFPKCPEQKDNSKCEQAAQKCEQTAQKCEQANAQKEMKCEESKKKCEVSEKLCEQAQDQIDEIGKRLKEAEKQIQEGEKAKQELEQTKQKLQATEQALAKAQQDLQQCKEKGDSNEGNKGGNCGDDSGGSNGGGGSNDGNNGGNNGGNGGDNDPVPEPPSSPDDAIKDLLEEMNTAREKIGVVKLYVSSRLKCAADRHSKDMGEKKICSHTGSDGSSPWDRASKCGTTAYGEIVACGQKTAQEAVKAWLNSPGHKKIMLDERFRTVGLALKNNYWTAIFGI